MMKKKDLFSVLVLMVLLVLWGCGGGSAADSGGTINLAWDPSGDPDVAGYKVYYGTATGKYDQVIDVGNVTTYQLAGLIKGQTYFIAVTAYNTLKNESGFSNEVSGTAR